MVWTLTIYILTLAWTASELYHEHIEYHKKKGGVIHMEKLFMRMSFFVSIPILVSVVSQNIMNLEKYAFVGPALFWPVFNIAYATLILDVSPTYIDMFEDKDEDDSKIDNSFNTKSIWIGYAVVNILAWLSFKFQWITKSILFIADFIGL